MYSSVPNKVPTSQQSDKNTLYVLQQQQQNESVPTVSNNEDEDEVEEDDMGDEGGNVEKMQK